MRQMLLIRTQLGSYKKVIGRLGADSYGRDAPCDDLGYFSVVYVDHVLDCGLNSAKLTSTAGMKPTLTSFVMNHRCTGAKETR